MPNYLEPFLSQPLFSAPQTQKEEALLPRLRELTEHHREACPAYKKIVDLAFPNHGAAFGLTEVPFLPISLFKHRRLRSVPDQDVRVVVQSSGTTGAIKSSVDLDANTAQLSAQALAVTLREILGSQRLPMLIIDTPYALRSEGGLGARASAILGLMPFGHDHTFILNDDLSLDEKALEAFLSKHKGKPILIYGFTFLVWQRLLPVCERNSYDLSNATLLHSGGWKNLMREYIDNESFKLRFEKTTGLSRVINFYGMAEMPGTIFPENTDGLLYIPSFAEVIIRDPATFKPVETGSPGIVQVLNLIPRSYPGHSLLTEDVGIVHAIDTGVNGWQGKALQILGRAPRAPLRGCSNVLAANAMASA